MSNINTFGGFERGSEQFRKVAIETNMVTSIDQIIISYFFFLLCISYNQIQEVGVKFPFLSRSTPTLHMEQRKTGPPEESFIIYSLVAQRKLSMMVFLRAFVLLNQQDRKAKYLIFHLYMGRFCGGGSAIRVMAAQWTHFLVSMPIKRDPTRIIGHEPPMRGPLSPYVTVHV